jgi:hypothetical protein
LIAGDLISGTSHALLLPAKVKRQTMSAKLVFLTSVCALYWSAVRAQPFVDVLAFSSQHFFSEYKDSTRDPLYVQDNFLNVFIPKKFGNDHVFLLRLNSERLLVSRKGSPGSSQQLYSVSLPLGCVLSSQNKRWKYTAILIPKINSDFKDDLGYDFQLGGIGLITRVVREDFQVRAGLYYNREFFGNFFMPLVGVDWKINNRFQVYGTMPSNYRVEYKLSSAWNTGFGFRSFQRSFRLNGTYGNDLVWVRENQVKAYVEGFIFKNLVLTVDVFRSIGYRLPRADYDSPRRENPGIPVFQPFSDNFGFTLGFAYRILKAKPEVVK